MGLFTGAIRPFPKVQEAVERLMRDWGYEVEHFDSADDVLASLVWELGDRIERLERDAGLR